MFLSVISAKYRQLPNGDLRTPHRGKPPNAPKGFEQDIGDMFLYHPNLDSCLDRVQRKTIYGCCRKVIVKICLQKNSYQVSYMECKNCKTRRMK